MSECTHVVAMRSENIPENVHEEVPAVRKEWVEESIAKGMQEPTDEYEIRGGGEDNEQARNPLQGKHFLVIGFDDVSRDGTLVRWQCKADLHDCGRPQNMADSVIRSSFWRM